MLDGVAGQFTRLSGRVSTSDRQRLDAHLTTVREIETRLTTDLVVNNPACRDPSITPVSINANDLFPAVGSLQMDLMVMALACDITRIASLQWSRSVSQTRFTWADVTEGHHDLSHRPDSEPAALASLIEDQHLVRAAARDVDHAAEGDARRRRRLGVRRHADPVGQRAGEGNTHGRHGRAATCWRAARAARCAPGAVLSYEGQGLPHNNLLVSILNAMGVPDAKFGKPDWCTGPLTGLL